MNTRTVISYEHPYDEHLEVLFFVAVLALAGQSNRFSALVLVILEFMWS